MARLLAALVASPALAAALRQCGPVEQGVCYYGDELATLEGVAQDECCRACLANDTCAAYRLFAAAAHSAPNCTLLATHSAAAGAEDLTDSACASGTLAHVAAGGESCADGSLECAAGFYCQRRSAWFRQCVPTPARCAPPQVGVDFFGDDLRRMRGLDLGECCDACAADRECAAYTLNVVDGQLECFLKHGAGERVAAELAVSGTVQHDDWAARGDEMSDDVVPPGRACGSAVDGARACAKGHYCQPWNAWNYQCVAVSKRCGVPETDTSFIGSRLGTVKGLAPFECCDRCAQERECAAYTFVSSTADGRSTCHLQRTGGARTRVKGAIAVRMSGISP